MQGRGCAVAVGLVVGLGVALAAPRAMAGPDPKPDPKPTVIDIKPFKDQLLVFQDAKGGTYAVQRTATDKRVFYGTGKTLYQQSIIGGGGNGDAWSISIWAPRVAELRPGLIARKKDGTFEKTCDGKDDAVLTQLTGDKANAVLDKYAFMSPASMRRPYLLARDDAGVYYYVDMLMISTADRFRGTAQRVFVGKKGAMKHMPLTDIASDSAGDVFSTKTGDLRLVKYTDRPDAKASTRWVKGEKKTELVALDVDVNSHLIFTDLGVYTFIGSICENI